MAQNKVNKTFSDSSSSSQSSTSQSSTTQKVLDTNLLNQILAGLTGQMTDDEIRAYAESLLTPTKNAELEAAQQNYETTKLGKEQEIENLAATLARSIQEQRSANAQSKAAIETAALGRGMGRSSYTLQTLANQDNALARVVQQLTEDNARQQNQIQQQITQAAQQNAQTQGRINTDYASQLAAKTQELKQNQQNAYNQNYMTAVSAAMGSQTTGMSKTTGTDKTNTVNGEYADDSKKASTTSSGGGKKPTGTTVTVNQKT